VLFAIDASRSWGLRILGSWVEHVGSRVKHVGSRVEHVGYRVEHVGSRVEHVGCWDVGLGCWGVGVLAPRRRNIQYMRRLFTGRRAPAPLSVRANSRCPCRAN